MEVRTGLEALDPNPSQSDGKSLAVRVEDFPMIAAVNSEGPGHERVLELRKRRIGGDEANLVYDVALMTTWKEWLDLVKRSDPKGLEVA